MARVNRRLRSCQIRLISVFLLILAGLGQTQEDNHQVIVLYEHTMNEAAKHWLGQNYAAALDEFDSAKKILLHHMPLPSDGFSWNTFQSLKIYTILLTRLVEVERYQNEEQSELSEKARKQSKDWASDLKNQTKIWMAIKCPFPEDETMRLRWMKRFYAVIQKVKTEY
jgi:hypothetical protein